MSFQIDTAKHRVRNSEISRCALAGTSICITVTREQNDCGASMSDDVLIAVMLGSTLTTVLSFGGLFFRKARKSAFICLVASMALLFAEEELRKPNMAAHKVAAAASNDQKRVIAGPAVLQPNDAETGVLAFAFKPDLGGGRGLFVDIRGKRLSFGGKQIWVLCPADGTGEIVALLDDSYVAVNGAARGWAGSKMFWAVKDRQLVPISDFGFPNDVPKRFEGLEPHVNAIMRTGVEMCPLAAPASENAWRSLTSAVQNYQANARRLGISVP